MPGRWNSRWDPALLEAELPQTWAERQHQAQEYKALLNIKVKLEAEITTYRCRLEAGENFGFGDALDNSNSIHSILKTTTTGCLAKWCLRSVTPKF